MEVKIRSIGNVLGIILPKSISELMHFNAEDTVKLDVEKERLVIARKRQSLKKNLLSGIKASEHENIEFVQSFDELEKEAW